MLTNTILTTLAAAALLSGCANPLANAERLAAPAALIHREIPTATFRLTAFTRLANPTQPIVVYIEGDGLAWKSISEPALNPTPRDAVGLRLAALDPSPNVVYLARPCQFTKNDGRCRDTYWTDRRFADDVIVSMNDAIDAATGGSRGGLHLVGYSGGGAVAALIAARRNDILSLRTVAGNLDHVRFTRFHGVSPMPGSLNAIDVAPRLAGLPQAHFTSETDGIVPPFIAEAFVAALGDGRCATLVRVPAATHADGWHEEWRRTVSRLPRCR